MAHQVNNFQIQWIRQEPLSSLADLTLVEKGKCLLTLLSLLYCCYLVY